VRAPAERMARHGVGRLPVVSRENPHHVEGLVTRSDLMKARLHALELEHDRERTVRLPGGKLWGVPEE